MSAISLEKSNRISPANLHHYIINEFHLSESIHGELERYYCLWWSSDYFYSQMQEGSITHQNTRYLVVYQTKPHELRKCEQIQLSFRKPKSEYNLCAYVIVRKGI